MVYQFTAGLSRPPSLALLLPRMDSVHGNLRLKVRALLLVSEPAREKADRKKEPISTRYHGDRSLEMSRLYLRRDMLIRGLGARLHFRIRCRSRNRLM